MFHHTNYWYAHKKFCTSTPWLPSRWRTSFQEYLVPCWIFSSTFSFDLETRWSTSSNIDWATLSSGMPLFTLRLIGHTHDRESPIQNFSTAPKKLGAHISSPVWQPKPTEFVSYLGNLRCDAFTALKYVQSARNESFLAGSDNFHRVLTAIEFEAWLVIYIYI